ncbi:hypothetical protein FRC06_007679 [Ceratobasidium sp. 370]|nr:hypothetical protein FRC06_007679 [Ceratobasidium sp. 370]
MDIDDDDLEYKLDKLNIKATVDQEDKQIETNDTEPDVKDMAVSPTPTAYGSTKHVLTNMADIPTDSTAGQPKGKAKKAASKHTIAKESKHSVESLPFISIFPQLELAHLLAEKELEEAKQAMLNLQF